MSDIVPSAIVLVSGLNADIGFTTVRKLALDNPLYNIILGITSDTYIATAFGTIEKTYGHLDILVNNAGIHLDTLQLDTATKISTGELYTQTFDVNVIGTACLTDAILPLLKKSPLPRVVVVSSELGSITTPVDTTSMAYALDLKAYRAIQTAGNMLAATYAMLLKHPGGKSNTVCPGLVQTKLNGLNARGTMPNISAEIEARMATWVRMDLQLPSRIYKGQ